MIDNTNKLTLENIRKNPYITATFILLLLVLIILVGDVVENERENKMNDELNCFIFYGNLSFNKLGNDLLFNCSINETSCNCKEINLTELKGGNKEK